VKCGPQKYRRRREADSLSLSLSLVSAASSERNSGGQAEQTSRLLHLLAAPPLSRPAAWFAGGICVAPTAGLGAQERLANPPPPPPACQP